MTVRPNIAEAAGETGRKRFPELNPYRFIAWLLFNITFPSFDGIRYCIIQTYLWMVEREPENRRIRVSVNPEIDADHHAKVTASAREILARYRNKRLRVSQFEAERDFSLLVLQM